MTKCFYKSRHPLSCVERDGERGGEKDSERGADWNGGGASTKNLIRRNIIFYARYYRLIAIAVTIATGIITGSLLTGYSVRTTLVKRVAERLGNAETFIFARNSFMDEKIATLPLFGNQSKGILLVNGFVSHSGRLIPVMVWGVNDMQIQPGSTKINSALAQEMEMDTAVNSTIVLRLPAHGLVPSGSLFVTDNYTTSMRLQLKGTVGIDEGGNITAKNEQAIPLNIFVNRQELAETMETPNKINLITSSRIISQNDFNKAWNSACSGIETSTVAGSTQIISSRVFLHNAVTETICRDNSSANRLFSYLASSIEANGTSIPYSFVTAIDSYGGQTLQRNEIILSDYAAKHLNASTGDSVMLTFFTSGNFKTLKTDTILLKVKKTVPLADLVNDNGLSANFPGLSDVERCTEWDSDLPINMDLITDDDETYWEHYRSTPKALIAYSTAAPLWSNAYGNATAIRVDGNHAPILSGLCASMFGIQLFYPRNAGIFAAQNGVDFAGLFLALGFFIIIAAALLMLVPLSGMFYKRRHEMAMLQSLGYSRKRIVTMLWRESAPVVLVSSVVGVIAGLLYTSLIMWLLGNVWRGATHTDGFAVYISAPVLLAGFAAGVVLSMLLLRYAIVQNLKTKQHTATGQKQRLPVQKAVAVAVSLLAVAVTAVNLLFVHSVILFVMIGVVMIVAAALWGSYLIARNSLPRPEMFTTRSMMWNTLYASRRQVAISFFALTAGVFTVFSVGLNRRGFTDSTQLLTGTGGYTLWCETGVPVYHSMNTPAGRNKLSLTELPPDTEVLQCLRYSADDASCLNLNKVSTPTVLGVDMEALLNSSFSISQSIDLPEGRNAFERLSQQNDSVYPALVDVTVLTWSLVMKLGDTLHYKNDRGRDVAIRLVGTLPNTIFQGNILIDRSLFTQIWSETAGSEVFIIKTNGAEREVKTLVTQALNEYGVRVTTTADRLKQFNAVTDTYLTIFMTLGGLGLLLGIAGFVVAVRKNMAMRRWEIELYKTLGFAGNRIEQVFYIESLPVPLYAIATGTLSAFAGVGANAVNTGLWTWLMALLFTGLFVVAIVVFVRKSVQHAVRV